MALNDLLQNKRDAILGIAARHGARNIRVFGSVARGDATDGSDIDFLVEMEQGRSLMDMGGLLMELQDLLGCKVDLVEPQALHWYIRDRVLREAVAV